MGVAFAEQDPIPLVLGRRPVFAVERLDASWISLDPSDRIGTAFKACADVELKRDVFRSARRDYFQWSLAVDRNPFGLVVVIAGPHSQGPELLCCSREPLADLLPIIQAIDAAGACHNDVSGAQSLVQVDGFLQAAGCECV